MSLRHHLRRYDGQQTSLERQLAQHIDSKIVELSLDERYLCLSLTNPELGDANAMLNIDTWLQEIDMDLPGIPWQHVPLSYLVRWLNEMQLGFLVQGSVWEVQNLAAVNQPLPEKLLLLPAQPCPLLCLQWPGNSATQRAANSLTLSEITFSLDYVLGNSYLPLSMLVDIDIGDLLLIKNHKPRLKVGQQSLFKFSYNQHQEIIVEQQLHEESSEDHGEEEVLFQWSKLPVNIEFVLDSRTVTLAELENVSTGSILPLSTAAEQKVKIYLNRKLFARGELVQLDNGTLAVEINQISQHADAGEVYSDVE